MDTIIDDPVHGIDNFLPSAVAESHGEHETGVVAGLSFCVTQLADYRVRKVVQVPNRKEAD